MERDGPPSLCNQVTTNLNGGVNFWWAFVGSVLWTDETVLTSGPYEETSIATDSSTHAAIIAATGFNPLSNGPVGFFSAVYGTGSWQGEVVSGTGTASSAPVINPDSVNGYNDVNISLVGPGGQVRFDFSAFRSGTWYGEAVPGNGTVGKL